MPGGNETPSKDHLLLHPSPDFPGAPDWGDTSKNRRCSTIHSYNLTNYHTLPDDARTLTAVKNMTKGKAIKNTLVVSVAFMFMFTAFVSLQSLQSTLHPDGLGLVSLSCIYGSTVLSCLTAPWLINRLTTKWTMVIAFVLFTGYVGANFHPTHYVLIPTGIGLGLLGGPLWSAQATYVTTLAVTYANHMQIDESDAVINKFMGIFCGFYRSSQIWGNLISALVLQTNISDIAEDFTDNATFFRQCGASDCDFNPNGDGTYNTGLPSFDILIPNPTKYMLLSIYLGCGIMGTVILVVLLDKNKIGKTDADPEFDLTSLEILVSTLNMFRDPKCLLLIPMVLFVGLEQGFIFGDFTKSYVNCTLGINSIGRLLVCFGTVSALSSIVIGCIAHHIKRFAFITAAAFFNVGILIVLWLWRPLPADIPNFYVVSGCLGLCDAIWQTQTYTLFGVLFTHKQEAAFASYRMLHATGCAIAFGYSYFLCVETKVYVLAAVLGVSLSCYSYIEMKVQLQSQHMLDIVAL